ncbi:MAG TPA: hypothetical protein QF604_20305 [Candidatus Latescibacteria bacterium]|jgi:hypothetical protein|nr:hypothetical protein [Gemmatimonadota bacterium]MDP7363930.1 hypothetical protein [Candidatus Latescibacterota bacterium]MDP7631961.1 hypothetical protein [Candidatus Latescibacterota bacterium]HJN30254.1 hypothetical protein [Candidatus Latescibacterota bacterium]|tara:strand:- start:2827 stop:3495 length:669 start_codon:yes stop_codon:yes gene_type:complete
MALRLAFWSALLCLVSVVDGSTEPVAQPSTTQHSGIHRSTTKGWGFGFDAGGATGSFDNQPSDGGPLAGARVGYGFNRIVTLYAAAYEADVKVRKFDGFDEVSYGHIDYGMRLHLPNRSRRWVPYADLALFCFRPVSDVQENGTKTTSNFGSLPSGSLGFGLAVYLTESRALDVKFKGENSAFNDVEIGNISTGAAVDHTHTFVDIPTKSDRFTIGISWWPK